ncbi:MULTISPECIES: ribonuclease T2 family protein [Sphingobium]|uniref:Ribonuclease T n=2 Tax=Sphingobium cupriresistens TaxID=1132417 RepID=A0A0J7XVY5_9SPHN|nr:MULTISPECIES: ribonuclease T2 [Sphingobium]KMS55866.1 ribonuclease T [Sphingobium cupriresistens LL01]MBJ7378577.1 ribonuclease T2 [Sphingobium sp.]RYM13494.1 ribonuclease T [Sphingobium cupriresistens]
MLRAAIAIAALAIPGVALAQSAQCSMAGSLPRPQIEAPSAKEPKRVLPIGSYTLALSWSPQYCSTARGAASRLQCGGRNGRFGFTLHGLWPDGMGREWPQYCRPADLLPRQVLRANLCTTPSVQLLQHEWAKHGTCMTTKPELYFNLSRAFYQSLRYPDMAALARRPTLTVGQFAEAFARANKGLRADMLRVTTVRGNWLSEIWLCMDRALEFTRCPSHQGGASTTSYLRIEPGPVIANPRRPVSTPRRRTSPARKPGLILDLDPKVQPLGNSAG